MYSIYKHTNKENGKVYVGITSKPVEQRWANGHGYKNNLVFYKDILEYGWNNFTHEIICTCDTYEEALQLEEHYIKENINNCYNVAKATSTVSMHSKPITKSCTVSFTKNTAQKSYHLHISKVNIPIVEKPKNRRSCPVSQYSMDGVLLNVFPSAKIASNKTGINHGSIISCCKGGRSTGQAQKGAGGYIWRYNIDSLNKFPDIHVANKKVYQFDKNHDLICTYDSAIQAALKNNIPYSRMIYICSGRASSHFAFGYYWEYEE